MREGDEGGKEFGVTQFGESEKKKKKKKKRNGVEYEFSQRFAKLLIVYVSHKIYFYFKKNSGSKCKKLLSLANVSPKGESVRQISKAREKRQSWKKKKSPSHIFNSFLKKSVPSSCLVWQTG